MAKITQTEVNEMLNEFYLEVMGNSDYNNTGHIELS